MAAPDTGRPRSGAHSEVDRAPGQSPRSAARAAATRLDEQRGRGSPRADPGAKVALHPLGDRLRAAVGLEAVEVEPQALRPLPQVGVVEVGLVLEQRVVHLPEAPLQGRRLGGVGQDAGPRVLGLDREVAEDPRDSAGSRSLRWASAQWWHSRSAYSTTSGPVAAPVVVGPRLRTGRPSVRRGACVQGVEDEVGTGNLQRAGDR